MVIPWYGFALSDVIDRQFEKSALSFFFEVTNSTNRLNECCVDFETELDDDGNAVLLTEDEGWYPILPAIGLLWEF